MNYLEALTRRAVETVPVIRPRLPTLFEPVAGRPLDEALAVGLTAEGPAEIAADASSGRRATGDENVPDFGAGSWAGITSGLRFSEQTSIPRSAPRRMETDGRRSMARSLPVGLRGGDPGQAPAPVSSVAESSSLRPGPQIEPASNPVRPVEVVEAPTGRTSVRPPANDGPRTSAPAVQPRPEAGMPSAGRVAVAVSTSRAARPAQAALATEPGQDAPAGAPTVHIHIGRIEVRALPPPAPAPPAPPSRPAPRRQSLEEYLAGGGGRS